MFLFVENMKYGLMNQSAELIEAPVFEEIRRFQNPITLMIYVPLRHIK